MSKSNYNSKDQGSQFAIWGRDAQAELDNKWGKKGVVIWRWIEGYKGIYRVSTDGRVKSVDRYIVQGSNGGGLCKRWVKGSVRKTGSSGDGHRVICLYNAEGARRWVGVHRLVLLTFVGPCPDSMQCCHNDGDPANNRLGNLRWDTLGSNQADRFVHGTITFGSDMPNSKLTEEVVIRCRRLYRSGKARICDLAREYKVDWGTMSDAVKGIQWRHVKDEE